MKAFWLAFSPVESLYKVCLLQLMSSSASPTSRQTTAGSQHGSSLRPPTAFTSLSETSSVALERTQNSLCPSMTPSNRPSSGITFIVLLS